MVGVKHASRRFRVRREAQLAVGHRTSGKKRRRRFGGLILPGQEETFWCEFETAFCGNVEVILESVRLYDLFGIFYIKQKVQRKASVKVMPEFELMPVEITRATREFQADAEEYSGEKKGDDPSELYQVREYRIQDSVRDIHWKLSAKEETFMVKERGFPFGCVVLVWIDFAEKERSAAGFSRLLETAASLSITLAEQKCIHLAAWYEEKNERIGMRRVRDEESACELIWQLMGIEPYRDPVRKQACFDDTFRGHEFSSTVTIDGRGVLRNDGEVPELLRLYDIGAAGLSGLPRDQERAVCLHDRGRGEGCGRRKRNCPACDPGSEDRAVCQRKTEVRGRAADRGCWMRSLSACSLPRGGMRSFLSFRQISAGCGCTAALPSVRFS